MKPRPLKILLCAAAKSDPASRFRIFQFVPRLRRLGCEVKVMIPSPGHYWKSPVKRTIRTVFWGSVYAASMLRLLSRLPVIWRAGQYDIVMMNRALVPESWITCLEPWLRRYNPRIIFDFDDAIYLGDNQKSKISNTISASAWITPGNTYLAEFARQYNDHVTIIPTVVDTDHYKPGKSREPGIVRVGWTGSEDTLRLHLPLVRPLIVKLSAQEQFEFIVIANRPPEGAWPGVKMRFIPWNSQTEVRDHQLIDIGLMPLNDSPHERGKCGAKILLYGAFNSPAIASPVGVNSEIILQGETGFLAKTEEEWENSLRQLIRDPLLRKNMGVAARKRVEEHYSVLAILPRLMQIFEQTMALYPRTI